MNYKEFSQTIKQKYPDYANVDDMTLAKKIIEKYPDYSDRVEFGEAMPQENILKQATGSATSALGDVFGTVGKAVIGQPEAVSEVASQINRPVPELEQIGQKAGEYGVLGKVAGAMIPTRPIEFGTAAISPVAKAPAAISAIAKPLQRGVDVIGEASRKFIPQAAERSGKLVKEATNMFRTMINPYKGEIMNIEVRGGKNIDDYFRLAAEEKLPITKDAANKLDTKDAVAILSDKQSSIHDSINSLLDKSDKYFDLNELRKVAKNDINKRFTNKKELESAISDIDEYIDAEIRGYGAQMVNARDFNSIKQGMWSVGYNQTKPTTKATARTIGHVAKEMIEKGIDDKAIKSLNEKSGEYATLINLLENANGRPVQGGKLGQYFARGIGAITGSSLGVPGSILGQEAGARIASTITNPERVSRLAAKKIEKSQNILKRSILPQRQSENVRVGIPSSISQQTYQIGQSITAPDGRIAQVVGYDSDGHPIVEQVQ